MDAVPNQQRRWLRLSVLVPWLLFVVVTTILVLREGPRWIESRRQFSKVNDGAQQAFESDEPAVTRWHYFGSDGPFIAYSFGGELLDSIADAKQDVFVLTIDDRYVVMATYRERGGLISITIHRDNQLLMAADRQSAATTFPTVFSLVPQNGADKGLTLFDFDLDGVFEQKAKLGRKLRIGPYN